MMLWIKERNSALPRDGAARAASPPACAACILPPFRNLSRPNRLSVSWLGLRKPKDGIERPCSGTNFRIPVWLMPWSHIRNRSKSSPSKSGFPLIRRRWFAIEARANTSFFSSVPPAVRTPSPGWRSAAGCPYPPFRSGNATIRPVFSSAGHLFSGLFSAISASLRRLTPVQPSPRFSPLRHMRRGLFFLSLLARP